MKRLFRLAFALAALAVAMPAYAQQSENKLRWASTVSITAPDPYYNYDREAIILIGQLVWDTLIYRRPVTGEYEPLLAKSWQWVDATTLVFELREDVKFHDGRQLTAEDVAYTYNYISNPDNKINVQSNVNWIRGAEVLGDYKVQINLKAAFPPALEYIATLHAILPNGFYGADGKPNLNGGLVGTGPYRFDSFLPGNSMSLVRWGEYFEGSPKGSPSIDAIEYRAIPDASTQIAELLSGGLDWIWYLPKDQAAQLASMPDVIVNPAETMRISFLSMNVRDMEGGNPLQDIKVRQAIAHAIDLNTIIEQVIGDGGSLVTAPCYRTQFGCHDQVARFNYDPEKARNLLAEAGFASGLALDLVADSGRDRAWSESLAGYLSAVGINVNVHLLPYDAGQERIAANRTHLFLGDWGSYSINDVSALLNNFFTLSPNDMARDQEVAAALRAAVQTIDAEKRLANYEAATKRIAEQLYWLPLWTVPVTYAYSAALDFHAFPDENPRFFLVKWKGR